MSEDDDDIPQLSAETFAILQEFYNEEEERETRLAAAQVQGEVTLNEDWQLSQFWYDTKTVDALVEVAIKTVGPNGKIALISCPTLYKTMKEKIGATGEVTLYEYDRRFSIYGSDFIPYDYKSPLDIARDKASYYDLVVADPPFLSEECLTKTAVTIKFLTKHKILLCTGAIMAELAQRLLDLKKTSLEPKHQNNLANEFFCYSNYEIS